MSNLINSTLVPLILRLGLAAVFIFHGYEKVSGSGNEAGANWAAAMPKPPTKIEQLAVAYGELAGGIALAIGFLSRLAALGLVGIMAGAIYTLTGEKGFSALQGGYEYNATLIVMCVAVILMGSGTIAVDHMFFRRKPKAA
jgi:putative oxidoreductase